MDFSKKGVIKKQHEIKSTSKRLNTKIRISLFRVALICVLFVAIIGVVAVGAAAKGMIDSAPEAIYVNIDPEGFTTHVYYNDGTLAQDLIGTEANRVLVSIDNIPLVLQHAFVALEDERFYEHNGIDIQGIFRAGFSVIKTQGLGFGGSTITQQLLKIKVFDYGNEPNMVDKIIRKVQEQYLAIKLENRYSKDEILEAYLNNINLGNGSFGVQTAAQSYFGKDVSELTLSEAAVIAPIALSPVYQNPLNYPEANAKRRKSCLDNMLAAGYCTQAEYDEALNDDVYTRIKNYNEEKEAPTFYSYFTDALIEQIKNDLIEKKGYTQDQATDLIYRGGLEIYSTQQKQVQDIMDKYFKDESNFPAVGNGSYYYLKYALSIQKPNGDKVHYQISDLLNYYKDWKDSDRIYYHDNSNRMGMNEIGLDKEDMIAKTDAFREAMVEEGDEVLAETRTITLQPQTSMTIMDQHNGHVVALYGGRGEKTGNRVTNRATNSRRSVGSTFKVLASFLPALDTCGYTLASVMDDSEYTYPNSTDKVRNWNGKYKGLSSMREAIYSSMNIIACRFLEAVTPRLSFDYLTKLGFPLVESYYDANGRKWTDINYSLALGGLTNGVTNMELTAGYAAIANSGVYNKPVLYTKIVDHNGKVLLSNEPSSEQIFKTSTAWLLTNAMEDTISKGTASGHIKWKDGYKMPAAGKTGTSTSDYDLWFVGYTPYYTAAIWTGFDYQFSQTDKKYHQDIWRMVMEDIHKSLNLEVKSFEKPDSITTAVICTKCGNLAIPGVCDQYLGGNATRTEYFAKGTVPTKSCTCHIKVSVCNDSGHIASPYCPNVKDVVYLLKTETSRTDDTPFIYPTNELAEICPIHSEGTIAPPINGGVDTNPGDEPFEDGGPTEPVVPDDTEDPGVIVIPPEEPTP